MRFLKRVFIFLLIISISIGAYGAFAWSTASWYPGLNMEMRYNQPYFIQKMTKLQTTLLANPQQPVALTLTDQECDALLKLLIKHKPELKEIIKGVNVSLDQDGLIIRANLQLGSWQKGVETRLKTSYRTKTRELEAVITGVKLGRFPIPAGLLTSMLNRWLPESVMQTATGGLAISLKDIPLEVRFITVEPGKLTAEFALSPVALLELATSEKKVLDSVLNQAENLQEKLSSPLAKQFVESITQKKGLTPEDIQKALGIYNGLSASDKAAVQENLQKLLKDPEVRSILTRYQINI